MIVSVKAVPVVAIDWIEKSVKIQFKSTLALFAPFITILAKFIKIREAAVKRLLSRR